MKRTQLRVYWLISATIFHCFINDCTYLSLVCIIHIMTLVCLTLLVVLYGGGLFDNHHRGLRYRDITFHNDDQRYEDSNFPERKTLCLNFYCYTFPGFLLLRGGGAGAGGGPSETFAPPPKCFKDNRKISITIDPPEKNSWKSQFLIPWSCARRWVFRFWFAWWQEIVRVMF